MDAADELLSLQLALSELTSGPLTKAATRAQFDVDPESEFFDHASVPQSLRLFDTELVVDAKSLFAALSAAVVREPSESHVVFYFSCCVV